MDDNLYELEGLLNSFSKLKIKEKSSLTFLEIAKFPHLEIVWSNILAFYFNPNNEHKLDELFLKSLFESLNINFSFSNIKSINVQTEFITKKGNRIDLVIFADDFLLCIENKINALIYNDLEDYSTTIDSLAKYQNLPTFKILLSKNRVEISNGFINLRYSDFIETLKDNLIYFTNYSDPKYLIFLIDFINNVEKHTIFGNMEDELEVIDFLQKNITKVNKLIDYHNKLNNELVKKLDNIDKKVNWDEINALLQKGIKPFTLAGPSSRKKTGRFTWKGSSLIRYNIKIGEISLFYQIGFTDYKLHSHFWIEKVNYHNLISILNEKGIRRTEYEFNKSDDSIALFVTTQMKEIIFELQNY